MDVQKIKALLQKKEGLFLKRYFSHEEIDFFKIKKDKSKSVAANLAAKIALIKARGKITSLKEISLLRDKKGKPFFKIKDKAEDEIKVSITHEEDLAIAIVII